MKGNKMAKLKVSHQQSSVFSKEAMNTMSSDKYCSCNVRMIHILPLHELQRRGSFVINLIKAFETFATRVIEADSVLLIIK